MTRAYSQDLRDRVIASVEREGLSRRAAARRYRIGEATAVRWLRAWREGRREAQARGGLWDRIGQLVNLFPPPKCQNYLRHAGYEPL